MALVSSEYENFKFLAFLDPFWINIPRDGSTRGSGLGDNLVRGNSPKDIDPFSIDVKGGEIVTLMWR
jgi:hypothetical protein